MPPETLEFEVVKHVTLPLLKQETGVPLYLRIEDKIYKAKELTGSRQRKSADGTTTERMAPPDLVTVFNLQDKHTYTFIANAVFAENIRDTYPQDAYVGKNFMVTRNQLAGSAGRKYATYDITEIRPKATASPLTAPAPTPISHAKPEHKPEPSKAAATGRR